LIAGTAILLVESDRPLGQALARELAADGFRIRLARSAGHARSLSSQGPPALVLMGGLEGTQTAAMLLAEIRGQDGHAGWEDRDLPVLVFGKATSGLEVLRAFDAGADDFMAMPIAYLELRARIRAILRRTSAPASATEHTLAFGPLTVDLATRRVTLLGQALELPRMEFELLARLIRQPETVLTRHELLLDVWGRGLGGQSRTLDTHASRLRRRLGAVSPERWIPGVRGVGYRLI
jgi:DNA-binding response OmpR family regulator